MKFLGPYYMLLITKRRQIGAIYGHAIYAVTKAEMIALPNSTILTNKAYSKDENRFVLINDVRSCCNSKIFFFLF